MPAMTVAATAATAATAASRFVATLSGDGFIPPGSLDERESGGFVCI